MHPILTVLRLGDRHLPIGSYGVLLCAAIALAVGGALREARRAQLDLGACIAGCGMAIAGAFAGAALLHGAVQCLRFGTLHALLLPPGLAFFGAAFGAAAVLSSFGRALGVPVLAVADLAVPWFCLAHALGRVGCVLGGCCFGVPSEWPLALRYTHPLAPASVLGVPLHPLPLYEAAGLCALACVFALRAAPAPGSGRRLLSYAAAYSALRALLEPLRGDEVRGVFLGGAVSSAQLIAGGVLIACAFMSARVRRAAPL